MCTKKCMFFLILQFTLIFGNNYSTFKICDEMSDLEVTLESEDYLPLTFTCTVEYGYKYLIKVKEVYIAGDCSDYLIIKPGLDVNDGHKAYVFTQLLRKPKELVIPSNELFIKLVVNEKCPPEEPSLKPINKHGFKLTYQRIGRNIIVTTPNPITPTPWPIPSANDSIYLAVHMGGRSSDDYLNKTLISSFKKAVAGMGNEYCKANDVAIHLKDEITEANVQVDELKPCPYSWPDSENCVLIRFALPVIQISPQSEYQLVTSHLVIMWERYSAKYLLTYGFDEYEIPDTKLAITWWAVVIAVATALFLILITAGVSFNYLKHKCWPKEDDDSSEQVTLPKNDYLTSMNGMSMMPDRLQSVPNIFEDLEPRFSIHNNRESLFLEDEHSLTSSETST